MNKQPYVYILASSRNGTLYVGVTSDLIKRIYQHRNNLVAGFTERYQVHTLVWFEAHERMESAILREKEIKRWRRIAKLGPIEKTNPEWKDLWIDFCGILYLLKSGCQWRMLPNDFPKWRTVYAYFEKWRSPAQDSISVLEQALKNQVGEVRCKQGRNASTSFIIVDAQSVKNTDSAEQKGYERARRYRGLNAILPWTCSACPMRSK